VPGDADAAAPGWDDARLVRYLPDDSRRRLRDDFGEVFYLMARAAARKAEMADDPAGRAADLAAAGRWNRLAEGYGGDRIPRAVREQRADLARLAGETAGAARWADEAGRTPPASARDRYLLGYWLYQKGRYRAAADELAAATAADPTNFSAWFVRGSTHLALEQNDLAAASFTAAVALRPDFAPAWLDRGLALTRLRMYDLAHADFAAAARLDPTSADAHVMRGGTLQAQDRHADAVAAFTAALVCPGCPTRVYFYRAHSRDRAGDKAGAGADRAAGMRQEPADELSWIARAEAQDAPAAALADVDRALVLNPLSAPGLQLKAHLLAEPLNNTAEAVWVLDRAVAAYPEHVPIRAGRAVLRARLGDRAGSHADADDALRRDARGPNLYQVGCTYALTSKTHPEDRFKAVELIGAALRAGFGADLLPSDHDLDPIRQYPEFRQLLKQPSAAPGN
jgi:tetratricopeptide (TPR) repeat protein